MLPWLDVLVRDEWWQYWDPQSILINIRMGIWFGFYWRGESELNYFELCTALARSLHSCTVIARQPLQCHGIFPVPEKYQSSVIFPPFGSTEIKSAMTWTSWHHYYHPSEGTHWSIRSALVRCNVEVPHAILPSEENTGYNAKHKNNMQAKTRIVVMRSEPDCSGRK